MAMILFVCQCGQRIMHSDKRQPICTRCRDPKPAPSKVCTHRGPRIGNASCGCGAVYRCQLLNIFCGNKQPLEFADFEGTILDETNFRCCKGCPDDPANKPKPCSVCGKPSTTICSATNSFAMCGEPLCDTCRCRYHG